MMIQSTIKKMAVRMITAQIHQSILRPPKKICSPCFAKEIVLIIGIEKERSRLAPLTLS